MVFQIKKKITFNLISSISMIFSFFAVFSGLSSAGYIPTTVNYVWPFFFGLLHFYILKNYILNRDSFVFKENSVAKILIYIILIFSILFAISNEIISLLFILIYLCVILYYKYKNKYIPIYIFSF